MLALRSKTRSAGVAAWTVAQLGAFYSKNRSELHSHAFRILKDSPRSEEVVQEALLKVLLAAPELESEEHALGYVHRTIENICIDIFRLEGRRPNLVLIDEASGELESKWQSSRDHAEIISAADDAAIVRQALAMLSQAERSALIMWEIEGRSTKEIARELGVKEATVRHTVSRARASLRRIMSEMIIDKERGLTALDLLSNTYKKASGIAKKSSKIALSMVLVVFAFLGFNSLPTNNSLPVASTDSPEVSTEVSSKVGSEEGTVSSVELVPAATVPSSTKSQVVSENARSTDLRFPGLDKVGVPTGFTIADSTGSLGSAYFTARSTIATETELSIGQIIKTDSGAANIFISQTLTTDSSGLNYRPTVAFGQAGSWTPVLVRVTSTDVTRTMSGNYLFTAYIAVESALDTPIKIAATANGRDLAAAPRQVITRMVLDPSKTQVLAQAIYVVEKGAKA
jgi:RNA polymerase sigma factor (sigma-70 family)